MSGNNNFLKDYLYGCDDDNDMIQILAFKREREKLEAQGENSRQSRTSIDRDTLQGHQRLFNDYFATPPVFPDQIFRRRFRMRRELFMRIHSAVEVHDPYFQQKRNAAGKLGLSSLQKTTVTCGYWKKRKRTEISKAKSAI
ncbi:uncharacterized protein LOC124909874 [Impatiens glandulifera]|uniref:uncharacterized protein LOC124909874 n=1 Tax=Impatiens glandulifera TaxID=253017 RepID=UPI001FB077C9|nr:uncharacterized protein LOC124909874 [Impatiens glandulifera]